VRGRAKKGEKLALPVHTPNCQAQCLVNCTFDDSLVLMNSIFLTSTDSCYREREREREREEEEEDIEKREKIL
jgi:hypothetical protein